NNSTGVIAGANCPATYHGDQLAGWSVKCWYSAGIAAARRDSSLDGENEYRHAQATQRYALEYVSRNKGRAVVITGARVLRTWGLVNPGDEVRHSVEAERRFPAGQTWGQFVHWAMLPLA